MLPKDKVFYGLIIFGIFMMIVAVVMISKEVQEAQDFCNSINGTYKFGVYHICNGEIIEKYKMFGKTFWGFDAYLIDFQNASRELNWSQIN